MNELALFAGAGGGILGGHLLGWRTVCAVEIEDYPRRVLLQRQADGFLPRFPIWDDVRTFDGKPWKGKVDVISGGFPCQDISIAGGGGEDLMVQDQDYGAKWQGSFAKYDPNTHSLKTHQCLLFEDSTESCVILPRWGLMQDGECWEQMTLVQTMKEKESGLLQKYPTPSASDGTRGTMPNWVPIRPSGHPAQYPLNQALRDLTGIIGKPNPIFVEWLMGWPMQWTDLKPLEMDKFHLWQQQHGEY